MLDEIVRTQLKPLNYFKNNDNMKFQYKLESEMNLDLNAKRIMHDTFNTEIKL